MAILSGKTTVTTAGTAVVLGNMTVDGPLMVKAELDNTNNIYVGNVNGDVASTNGMALDAGEVIIFNYIGDLNNIWIDSDTNGEGVSWLLLGSQ
jgi:hypothetical protein